MGWGALELRAGKWLLLGKWLGELDIVSLAEGRLVFSLLPSLASNLQVLFMYNMNNTRRKSKVPPSQAQKIRLLATGNTEPPSDLQFCFGPCVPSVGPATPHLSVHLTTRSLIQSLTSKHLIFK